MRKSIAFAMTVAVFTLATTTALYAQRGQAGGRGPAAGPSVGRGTVPVPARGEGQTNATVGTAIQRNEKLVERLTPMLPPNTTLEQASTGFKNQGLFIAALQVSKNLVIPFDALKLKMTGEDPVSLGQAIDELRPELSENEVKIEVEKAEKQARELEK